ncbi:MAG TPA: hypothetical protein VMU80_15215 [Bryobacteraceae bacterium]|nr:hypothetical protein [Bryobacteraceae bacterium]
MKPLLGIVLAALCALAQDNGTVVHSCGPENVNFDVKLDKTLTLPKREPGKALVYVIQDGFEFSAKCLKCPATARVGLDGAWVGANNNLSWLSFSVAPGSHHLCAALQASKLFRSIVTQRVSLTSFTAQAGLTYYFRVRLLYGEGGPPLVDLLPINTDEGRFLVSSYYPSVSKPKK